MFHFKTALPNGLNHSLSYCVVGVRERFAFDQEVEKRQDVSLLKV